MVARTCKVLAKPTFCGRQLAPNHRTIVSLGYGPYTVSVSPGLRYCQHAVLCLCSSDDVVMAQLRDSNQICPFCGAQDRLNITCLAWVCKTCWTARPSSRHATLNCQQVAWADAIMSRCAIMSADFEVVRCRFYACARSNQDHASLAALTPVITLRAPMSPKSRGMLYLRARSSD